MQLFGKDPFEHYKRAFDEVCKANRIHYLLDEEVRLDGRSLFAFIDAHSSNVRQRKNPQFDHITFDIARSISYHIKISVGNVFLFRNLGLWDFEANKTYVDGRPLYRHFPTFNDARFFFYANTAWEKLYNYWDRVGDLLWLALELENLPEHKVYFGAVIDELERKRLDSGHFAVLKHFKDREYEPILNRIRKKIVHYEQKDTVFFFDHLDFAMDEPRMLELIRTRDEIPDVLKRQAQFAIEGFGHAVRLIGELVNQ